MVITVDAVVLGVVIGVVVVDGVVGVVVIIVGNVETGNKQMS